MNSRGNDAKDEINKLNSMIEEFNQNSSMNNDNPLETSLTQGDMSLLMGLEVPNATPGKLNYKKGLMKVFIKMKEIYKALVVVIADGVFDSKKMYEIEKMINDVIGIVGLYM